MNIFLYFLITIITIGGCLWIARYSVNISYRISAWAWIWVDVATFWTALLLMLCCSNLNILMAGAIHVSGRINTWIIIFIRQGGGVIFVTFFAGIVNRLLIQGSDLDKMKSYSTIYSRINFSIIGLICSYICMLDAKIELLADVDNVYLGQSIMWAIVIFETWISFEGLSKSRNSEKVRMKKKIENIFCQIKEYTWKPLLALLIGPLSFGLCKVIIIDNNIEIPELPTEYTWIVLYWIVLFIGVSIAIWFYRNPSTKKSRKRLKKVMDNLSVGEKKKTYFYGQRVMISKNEDLYEITIKKWEINIGKKNNLSKNLKHEIGEIFIDITKHYKKDDVEKILIWIKNLAEKRTLLLKDCFNNVQENYINSADNY